jgi:heme exporter protein C
MKGLHPGSADDANAGPVVDFQMNSNMQLIFFLSLIGFTVLYFWMWRVGYRSIIIKDKLNKQTARWQGSEEKFWTVFIIFYRTMQSIL